MFLGFLWPHNEMTSSLLPCVFIPCFLILKSVIICTASRIACLWKHKLHTENSMQAKFSWCSLSHFLKKCPNCGYNQLTLVTQISKKMSFFSHQLGMINIIFRLWVSLRVKCFTAWILCFLYRQCHDCQTLLRFSGSSLLCSEWPLESSKQTSKHHRSITGTFFH